MLFSHLNSILLSVDMACDGPGSAPRYFSVFHPTHADIVLSLPVILTRNNCKKITYKTESQG